MRQEISVRDCQKGKGEGEGDAVDDDEWLMRLCCVGVIKDRRCTFVQHCIRAIFCYWPVSSPRNLTTYDNATRMYPRAHKMTTYFLTPSHQALSME